MNVHVRLVSLDDTRGITEVHCSDVDEWFKWVNGKRVEAEYEELSIEERFEHGGPWMSVETCAIHLNYVLTSGQYPLVAELEGKVVGELELYIGEERSVLGKTAFIDILVVHRDFRRRGIGRALIKEARKLALEKKCNTLSVWPDKRAVPFYKKCGLKELAYEITYIVIDLSARSWNEGGEIVERFPESYEALKELYFVSPRIESAYTVWLKSRWSFAVKEARITCDSGYLPERSMAFIIESLWRRRKEARVILWVGDENEAPAAMSYVCGRARARGFEKLHALIETRLFKSGIKGRVPCEVKGREVVLMERL